MRSRRAATAHWPTFLGYSNAWISRSSALFGPEESSEPRNRGHRRECTAKAFDDPRAHGLRALRRRRRGRLSRLLGSLAEQLGDRARRLPLVPHAGHVVVPVLSHPLASLLAGLRCIRMGLLCIRAQ